MIDKQFISDAGKAAHDRLPDNHGFILLAFPLNAVGDANRAAYCSNAKREDAVKVLKEFLFRIGQGEDWMQHIK